MGTVVIATGEDSAPKDHQLPVALLWVPSPWGPIGRKTGGTGHAEEMAMQVCWMLVASQSRGFGLWVGPTGEQFPGDSDLRVNLNYQGHFIKGYGPRDVWLCGLHPARALLLGEQRQGQLRGTTGSQRNASVKRRSPGHPRLLNPSPGVGLRNRYVIKMLSGLFRCVSRSGSHQHTRKSPNFKFRQIWVQAVWPGIRCLT